MDRCNELCTKEVLGHCALCEERAEADRFIWFWFKGGLFIDGLRALTPWRNWKKKPGRHVDHRPPWDIPLITPGEAVPQQQLTERADQLRGAADEAARLAQNLYLSFLLLGTYIAVIIGSTTDVQLLKVSPVTLPILNVPLPIVGFYVFVPWLLLLVYFNLLLHLTFLAERLHQFNAVLAAFTDESAREEQRVRLFPFPFSLMLIGRPARLRLRGLLGLMVVTTVVFLPLLLLLWAQLRFSPYHDTAITWNHRAAVLVALALLWLFWSLMLPPMQRTASPAPSRRLWRVVQQTASARRFRWGTGLVCLTLVTVVLSLGIAIPEEDIEVWMASHLPGVLVHTYLARAIMFERPGGSILTRTDMSVFKLTFWLFERPGAFFHRKLQLQGQVLVDGDPSAEVRAALESSDGQERAQGLKKLTGLILTNRDLRGANLRNTLFPKADLRGANLKGTDLVNARVFAGNLSPLEIPQGRHCVHEAQEQGSETVCYTNLQGANLSWAQLQGADLAEAQLQGAVLRAAELQGAVLAEAQLQGADLQGAELQGAVLAEAQLQGADLANPRLLRVVLQVTQLQGADLRGAHLEGADLTGANIGSANFSSATLTWSDLRGLVPSPLDKKTYEELEKGLTDTLSDTRAREFILKRLQDAVGRSTNLSDARADGRSVLCDNVTAFPFCGTPEQIARYADGRAMFLVNLGCKGENAAAIARALLSLAQSDFLGRALAKHVTTRLEKDCPGWAALSADEKDRLRTLAAEENTVPK
jgi:uncharacterized protein YjbI with pentapeptide repeats